jgi:hypothetical protein
VPKTPDYESGVCCLERNINTPCHGELIMPYLTRGDTYLEIFLSFVLRELRRILFVGQNRLEMG